MRDPYALAKGQEIMYYQRPCTILRIYPYILYLRDEVTKKVECVNVGDLVMAGILPNNYTYIPQ
jgi:hypothetical protein